MQINLPEFIAKEEQNLIISLLKYRPDVEVFTRLDKLFQRPIPFMNIPAGEETLPSLYLFTHFQLYISALHLMRAHLSESFASTRKAIDATLSAYEIVEHPESTPLYKERSSKFKNIKAHISKKREKCQETYPLAGQLIYFHDVCSEYGSHADISSFIHRSEIKDGKITVQYFQFPKDDGVYHLYYAETLLTFAQMLRIFSSVVHQYTTNLDSSWEEDLTILNEALQKEVQICHQKIGK